MEAEPLNVGPNHIKAFTAFACIVFTDILFPKACFMAKPEVSSVRGKILSAKTKREIWDGALKP